MMIRFRKCAASFAIAIMIAACFIGCTSDAFAQAQYELGLGGRFFLATTPHSAGDIDILIGSGTTWSYNTIEVRPITSTQATITALTGVEHQIYKSANGRVILNAHGSVGVSTNATDTSAGTSGGGNVMVQLKTGKPYYLTVGGDLTASGTIQGTYEGQAKIGLRWILPASQ